MFLVRKMNRSRDILENISIEGPCRIVRRCCRSSTSDRWPPATASDIVRDPNTESEGFPMATNGTAALKLVETSELSSNPAPVSAPMPPGPAAGLEAEIGEAMVSAASWVAAAMQEYQCRDGSLSSTVKSIGGERIAKLVHLQMATEGQLDFNAVAAREGKRRLREYLDAEPGFRQRHGETGGEATLDLFITGALEMAANVVRFEKVMAVARAN